MHLNTTVIIIGALILFSIFRRVRRNIGWQLLNPGSMKVRIAIFLIIGLIFFVEGVLHPISLISDVVGILIGMILAYYSAAITLFEKRDERWYYRPNTWIGSIVTVIFLGRIAYRIYQAYLLGSSGGLQGGQPSSLQNMGYTVGNSWTAGLMLIMFAYYVIYYITLIRKQKMLSQSSGKLAD